MPKGQKLTDKQRIFIAEYLIDRNATRAAIAAGYSEKSANQIGSELLGKTEVSRAIDQRTEKKLAALDISSERVLRELALLGFANMMDYMTVTVDGQAYVDLSNLTRDQAAAIQEIKVDETGGGSGDNKREAVQRTTFRLASKKDALELLGKHLELFTDKHKFTGLDGLYERIAQARANAGRK